MVCNNVSLRGGPFSQQQSTDQDGAGLPWCTRYVLNFFEVSHLLTEHAATSVDVERAFSHGGGMVTKRRHALSAETIRANAVVSAWQRDGLVPEAMVVEKLGSRHSRKKKDVIEVDTEQEEDRSDVDAN